ncbi:uncharacterized protein LTR77_005534 [Saxophila tyrrhenica]|uniref:Peroxin/Ferlin domain-containing protein n=1 Tax=Saxophila tyrrhenica TaxID=1690608 RepID=A0AAV9P976_9PEZI|nr:hypothetical protein LTR77_005534 [Saxophila tyrrhenica]
MPLIAKAKCTIKKLTKKRRRSTDIFGSDRFVLMGDSNSTGYDRQQYDGPSDGTTPAPTVAAFSPNQQTASRTRNQKSVLIHQKSPLLVSTPPQVTRTLAYSHPFIIPLNHFVGLVSWTTEDPWESFLLLTLFWFVVLYGDSVVRWAGPVVLVAGLTFGMYSRRYSPLSSTVWSASKQKRKRAEDERRKSLDEILDTLQTFTGRCDVLLDPFLRLTEYLSTQSSATSATTRPALTTLFIRILAFTPIWIALTLPPFRIITTQRVVLVMGTTILSWHSRPARVTRTILWRSRTVRGTVALITGLQLPSSATPPSLPPRPQDAAAVAKAGKAKSPGITFTFSVYENERRWWGLGWTKSLLAYERQGYTDDQLNECPEPEKYSLPETDNETTKWRWLPDSGWKVEGALTDKEKSAKRVGGGGGGDRSGWTYYDNKWADAQKEDGWGRYTRRRKWIRDAELVEVDPAETVTADAPSTKDFAETTCIDATPTTPTRQRKGWFGAGNTSAGGFKKPPRQSEKNKSVDSVSISGSVESTRSRGSAAEEDVVTPLDRFKQYDWDRSINEGLTEQLS